jgi:hypothetical protein
MAIESIAIALTPQYMLDGCSKQPRIASNAQAISNAFKTRHSIQLLDSGDKNQYKLRIDTMSDTMQLSGALPWS